MPPIECTSRALRDTRPVVHQAPQPHAERVRERLGKTWPGAPGHRDGSGRGEPRGGGPRWSSRCRPSRRRAPGRCIRSRRSGAAPDAGRRSISPMEIRARASSSSTFSTSRNRRCASGWAKGSASAAACAARSGVPPVASSNSASAASAGRWSARSSSESSSAVRTSVQPRLGDAVPQELVIGGIGEERRLGRGLLGGRGFRDDGARDFDLAHGLADLDDLGRAGPGMPLDPPPLGPAIRGIVMVGVDQHDARGGAMHDQPDIPADPDGPEVPVSGAVNAVKRQPRRRRVQLQVEGGGLRGLLLVAGQLGKACREGVGDAEFHR